MQPACAEQAVLTEELVSEGISPHKTKIENELRVLTDDGRGVLGLDSSSTSHSTPPVLPSSMTT